MGLLSQILRARDRVLHVLDMRQSVAEAVATMNERQIGAVPVCDGDHLVGIFTERDLLRRVVARGRDLAETRLAEVMTASPVSAVPGEDRVTAIEKMRAIGCRHLPIVNEGRVIDMLSMRDLLFHEIAERETEVAELRGYISGSLLSPSPSMLRR